jgi:hypothetical protein
VDAPLCFHFLRHDEINLFLARVGKETLGLEPRDDYGSPLVLLFPLSSDL